MSHLLERSILYTPIAKIGKLSSQKIIKCKCKSSTKSKKRLINSLKIINCLIVKELFKTFSPPIVHLGESETLGIPNEKIVANANKKKLITKT